MAYENYNFVSWSDGSPLSSNRLGQMSINIEQVKDVVDDKAQGIIKMNQIESQSPNATGYSNFITVGVQGNEIIYLKNESPTGPDRRVSIADNRYYKLTVNVPAITIKGRGAEDSRYVIAIWEGTGFAEPNLLLASWEVSPAPYGFFDVSANANVSTLSVKTTSYPTKIGAGVYSVVQSTASQAITNKSFFVSIGRLPGANSNNAPNWVVEANSSSPLQFYVEDVGGV